MEYAKFDNSYTMLNVLFADEVIITNFKGDYLSSSNEFCQFLFDNSTLILFGYNPKCKFNNISLLII